ncbi:MAG: hypothetical protein GY845_27380 [Planctomycetes bacterium]|nr:hypothetical protein [Planctomycetota bacterium]
MSIQRHLVHLTALTIIFASIMGCAKKEDTSQPEPDPSAETGTPASVVAKQETGRKEIVSEETETPVNLSDVLSSWDAGDKERATEQFNNVSWDHPEVFANVPALNISEHDFTTSSQVQQIQFMKDITQFVTKLRTLSLHVLSLGDAALASGDKVTSKKHFGAVLQCAQTIASKDYYELIRLTAKGLIKAAEDKLSKVE